MNLEEEFPLRVVYPHGGLHWLLRYRTRARACQILLARSLAALEVTATRVFEQRTDAQIVDTLSLEIVGPSPRMRRLHAEQCYEDARVGMVSRLCGVAKESLDLIGVLPPGFQPCTIPRWEVDEDGEEIEQINPEWIEGHFGCLRCEGHRVILADGVDLDALYQTHCATQSTRPARSTSVLSRARPAREDESLWAAMPDFGSHSGGVILRPYVVGEPRETHHSYDPLFFYKPGPGLDKTYWQALQVRCAKVSHAQDEARQRAQQDAERAEALARVAELWQRLGQPMPMPPRSG